jgi:hypothetical protein
MEIKPRVLFINGKVLVDDGSAQWKVVISNCGNGYRYFDLTDECIAHYKMNDYASSTTVADAQGTQDATLTVNTVTISEAGYTGQTGDYSLHFRAGTDYLDCQNIAAWDSIQAFSCWFKCDNFSSDGGMGQTLLSHDIDVSNDKRIAFSAGSTTARMHVQYRVNGTDYGVYAHETLGTFKAATWYHVVVNFLSNGVQIFIDGQDASSEDTFATGHSSSSNLLIGALSTSSGRFDGYLDNVCLFNRTLTLCEVEGLYNSGNGTEKLLGCCCTGTEVNLGRNLVAHWKLNETSGTTVYDDSGNGLNGLLSADASSTTSTDSVRRNSHYLDATYYAVVDDDDRLSFGTGAFSISAWIKLETSGSSITAVVSKYDDVLNQAEYIFYTRLGALGMFMCNPGRTGYLWVYTADSSLQMGEWHHVAFTYDGEDTPIHSGIRLYIDGIDMPKTITATSFEGMTNGTSDFVLGGNNSNGTVNGSNLMDGYLDNVAIWNRMLSECEVKVLYGGGYGTEEFSEGCCPVEQPMYTYLITSDIHEGTATLTNILQYVKSQRLHPSFMISCGDNARYGVCYTEEHRAAIDAEMGVTFPWLTCPGNHCAYETPTTFEWYRDEYYSDTIDNNASVETYWQTIIQSGSKWKYYADSSYPAGSWKAAVYDDSSWSEGNAQLGFSPEGEDGETTTLVSGYNTYCFRKEFQITDVDHVVSFRIYLVRDDGAIVYLNGTELFRSNMPVGAISHSTAASSNVEGINEGVLAVYDVTDLSALVNGTNVFAVEVHQYEASSPDLGFNMIVKAAYDVDTNTSDNPSRPIALRDAWEDLVISSGYPGPTGCEETMFAIDCGDIRHIILNEYWTGGTNDTADKADGDTTDYIGQTIGPINAWLDNAMSDTSKQIMVYGHEPAFPRRDRHFELSLNYWESDRDYFWTVLTKQKALAAFFGHTHECSRFQAYNGYQTIHGETTYDTYNGPDSSVWQFETSHSGGGTSATELSFLYVEVYGNRLVVNRYRDINNDGFYVLDPVMTTDWSESDTTDEQRYHGQVIWFQDRTIGISSSSSSGSSMSSSGSSSSSSKTPLLSSSSSSKSSFSSRSSSSSRSSTSSTDNHHHDSHHHDDHFGDIGFVLKEYSEEEIEELVSRFAAGMGGMSGTEKEDYLIDLVGRGVITADQAIILAMREGLRLDT